MSNNTKTTHTSQIQSGRSKSVQSKYDYIKIKVWLGGDTNHYYILSRYILSRTLTSANIPQDSAIKIALLLKKWLVDHDILHLFQEELEQHMFRCIQEQGFTDVDISRFKLVNRFKQSRNPLVVFICGLPCDTKTRLAQELSHRLHVPNVLRTDDIKVILQSCIPRYHDDDDDDDDDDDVVVYSNSNRTVEQQQKAMTERNYTRECQIIQKAIQYDVLKAFKDGKSIIIEGYHLDPEYIIQQYSACSSRNSLSGVEATHVVTLFRQGNTTKATHVYRNSPIVNSKMQQQCALVIPILVHMDHDQYAIDSQQQTPHHQVDDIRQHTTAEKDRVYSTIGEYLQQTCMVHEIPCLHVDMVDWNSTLEEIHEYILQGIELVMHDIDI